MNQTNKTETKLIISEYLKEELLLKGHRWQSNNQINSNQDDLILSISKRKSVVNSLNALSQSMRTNFRLQLQQMCSKLDNEVDDLVNLDYESFQDIANELFSQGIKWSNIICLLVFASELILSTIDSNPSRDLIDNISAYLSTYINDNLLTWINDHQAWQGLLTYSNQFNTNETVVDGILKRINWHDNKYLRLGTAIGLGGIGIFLVYVLASKSK